MMRLRPFNATPKLRSVSYGSITWLVSTGSSSSNTNWIRITLSVIQVDEFEIRYQRQNNQQSADSKYSTLQLTVLRSLTPRNMAAKLLHVKVCRHSIHTLNRYAIAGLALLKIYK